MTERSARARRCMALLATATPIALLAALPAGARAQSLIGQFPAGVPGYGNELGVTVTSRIQPEYDAGGIRYGNFVIRPTLTESFGYDSNVSGTSPSRSSAAIETNASVAINNDTSRNSLGAFFSVDNYVYPDAASQQTTDWTASLGDTYQVGNDQVTLAYTHLQLTQTPYDIDSNGIANPVVYQVNDLRGAYTANIGHWSITGALEAYNYDFDNAVSQGQTFSQSFRNRAVIIGSVTGAYEFATQRSVVVVARGLGTDYYGDQDGQQPRNGTGFEFLGGVDYQLSGAFRFRLLAGYEQRYFQNSAYQAHGAPVFEGDLIWTPTGLTTVSATIYRSIEDAADDNVSGYTLTYGAVAVDHELFRNIILNGHFNAQNANYLEGGGDQTIYDVGAGAKWLLNRYVAVGANYDFYTSSGSYGSNYNRNLFLLSLTLKD